MPDVVLINPGNQAAVFQGLSGAGLTALEPPIWSRLIASHLRKHKISVAIVDAEAMALTPADAARTAGYLNPKLVAVVVHGSQPSASTQKMPAASATVQALKTNQPDVPVILVGGHPAALPEKSLRESGADYVCTGEGPSTVYDFIFNFGRVSPGYYMTRGLAWLGPNEYNNTNTAPNITDLANEMPGGCWDMLPMHLYRSYAHHAWTNDFQRTPYASIYTSLNCPYHCNFCMISSPFREGDKLATGRDDVNMYRTWPASSVIAEIEELVERYNVTNIRINDEMFVLQPRHVESICSAIRERYGDKLNLWCYGRVDQTRDSFLDSMRSAGFKWLCLGIEAVSDQVRDGVAKGEYGRDEIVDTVKRVKEHGINIIANYLFGLPDDDYNSMTETLDLALELKTEYINFYSTVAFPGSRLWTDSIKQGWKPPDNWLAWSFHSYEHVPLGTKHLSPAEVLGFRDFAFRCYYQSPSYRAYVLGKFGERAIQEIDFMLSHDLKRKLLEDKAA